MDWWYCVEMDGRINKWIAGFWMWCRKKRDRENLILSMEAALRVLIFFQDCKKLRFQEGWSCLIFILSSVQKGFISLWISLPSKKYFKLPPFPVACFCQSSCLNVFVLINSQIWSICHLPTGDFFYFDIILQCSSPISLFAL